MKTSEILTKAADLIEPEGAWTQGQFARNREGQGLGARRATAVCWCARGALIKITGGDGELADEAHSALLDVTNSWPLSRWNDAAGRTQSEVVAAFRQAAANEAAKGN